MRGKRYKFIPTREKAIRRIVEGTFLMIFGVYMIFLFSVIVGVICAISASTIIGFNIYSIRSKKNSLAALEIKITTEGDEV